MKERFYKYALHCVVCLSALSLASCLISQRAFQEVRYYDLGNPSAINQGGPWAAFSRFHVKGPYKSRMVFRGAGNELKPHEFHRWASEPEVLLERYLTMAFSAERTEGKGCVSPVSAWILVFEADENSNNARLSVEYTIGEGTRKKIFFREFSEKMAEPSPEALAHAMTQCAAALATQLKSDMQTM